MVTKNQAKEVAKYLVEILNPVSIIVFGSVAKSGKGNDLDLLIITDNEEKDQQDTYKFVCKTLKPFYRDFAIDPFVASLSSVRKNFLKGSPFLRLIQNEGRSLFMKDSVQMWHKQAKDELLTAKYLFQGNFFRGACYHAQQAIEKAFKGALIQKGWELEKVHSVERLFSLAEKYSVSVNIDDDDIIFIDSIYRGRYPAEEGLIPTGEPNKNDAQRAVDIAVSILDKVLPR
jgi:HEPN domain-containing protein/predicted nucleotidyltransferase